MSQCVPSWDTDDGHLLLPKPSLCSNDVPTMDYEVAELTWENGQLAMHGLGTPRSFPNYKLTPTTAPASPSVVLTNADKYAGPTWPDKPRGATAGTLEAIVNQATRFTHPGPEGDELVPWFEHRRRPPAGASVTMDALVPSSYRVGCSTRVGSCSVRDNEGAKRAKARGEWGGTGKEFQSMSGSATVGRDTESQYVTLDTCEMLGGAFTSTSFGSRSQTYDNTSYGRPTCTTGKTITADENDSVCHSRPYGEAGDDDEEQRERKGNGKSSGSSKRSRAAAVHNQSERKRRDKINQRMKTLQKLVPNSSKTDKASMLDEVIDYLKQLQAQVQMMCRMNMQPMMLPLAMQQQLQMSMMSIGMGMGMGVMDMNSIPRPNMAAALNPLFHPSAFMPPLASRDGSGGSDWLTAAAAASGAVMPDPFSAFLASQPVTMDAYSRMAALYQQLNQQPPASNSKN